jgi:hypothetical protein
VSKIEPELKSKLVALSLKGKWLSVAREYLISCWDGCTEEDYFANVTPLMPLHVNQFRQLPDPKMSAAKAALGRVGVQLEDGLWTAAAGAKRIKDEEQATEEEEQVSEEIMGYKVHPAAAVFPLIHGEEFDELCDSILKNGLREPVVVSGDVLIDGRNRLRAVEALRAKGEKVELRITQWVNDGRNVAEWIWDINALRRHMSEDAIVCASAAIWPLIAEENEARKAATKFDSEKASKAAKARHAVTTKTKEPQKRDRKAENARSTVGRVAAKAGTTMHKARQAVALDKAVEAGIVSPEVKQEVIAGKRKLSDAAKAIPAKEKKKAKTNSSEGDSEKAKQYFELQKMQKQSMNLLSSAKLFCRTLADWIQRRTWKRYWNGLKERWVEIDSFKEFIERGLNLDADQLQSELEILSRGGIKDAKLILFELQDQKVRIDSGQISALDGFDQVPKNKWWILVDKREFTCGTEITYRLENLIRFCAEARSVWQELGYESAEQMIEQGYGVEPWQIEFAKEWLRRKQQD